MINIFRKKNKEPELIAADLALKRSKVNQAARIEQATQILYKFFIYNINQAIEQGQTSLEHSVDMIFSHNNLSFNQDEQQIILNEIKTKFELKNYTFTFKEPDLHFGITKAQKLCKISWENA